MPYQAIHPRAATEEDRARIAEQAQRYRILSGMWGIDALEREADFFDEQLRESMPTPEISRNPALMVVGQIATLYDEPPTLSVDGVDDLSALMLDDLWAQSQARHTYTVGVNESLMRADWLDEDGDGEGRIGYSVIPPHMILSCRVHHEDPSRVMYVEEVRYIDVPDVLPTDDAPGRAGYRGWAVEIWDITGPTPRHALRYYDAQGVALPAEEERPWPDAYMDADGPILPHVLYHARVSRDVWSPDVGHELFWGTLTTACLWTFWLFGFRDASYDQRALVDGSIQGISARSGSATAAQGVVIDPRVVLQIKSDGERQAQLTSWSKTVDLKGSGESIEQFMAGLAMYAGISPSDITLGSGAQSGYAIVVSRHGQRLARRRQIPAARVGDRRLLVKAARLLNRNTGASLPTDPAAWMIAYAPVEMAPSERKAITEEVVARLDAGLLHPIDAYRELNPEVSAEQAVAALAEIAEARALLGAASRPADQVATVGALTSLGDKLPRKSLYWTLRRIGLLHPEEDIEALSVEPATDEDTPADEARDAALAAADLLSSLESADETERRDALDDLRETLADLLIALGAEPPGMADGGEE